MIPVQTKERYMGSRTPFLLVAGTATLWLGVAGCGSSSLEAEAEQIGITVPAGGEGTPVAAEAGEVSTTELFLNVAPTSVKAGLATFTLTNSGQEDHEMVLLKTDVPSDQLQVGAGSRVSEDDSVGEIGDTTPGETGTITLDLKAGKYVFVCNIAKHYAQGMRVAFTVE
jgi:uncharacterized cupredoxin-like copper-binding protein